MVSSTCPIWTGTSRVKPPVRRYSKGQELEATVLAIDGSRERISLGIKQLGQDPLTMFLADNQKGQMVKGTVKEVDAKGAVITLAGGVEGYIKAGDLSRDRVDDATKVLSVGQELESRFIGVDRKNRIVTLSVRAKEIQEEEEAVAEYSRNASTGKTSLGRPTQGTDRRQRLNLRQPAA